MYIFTPLTHIQHIASHLALSSRNVYGFCGTPCLKVVSLLVAGIALPMGVSVEVETDPSPIGLILLARTTGGVIGVGATRAVVAGTYVGTGEIGRPTEGGAVHGL